MVRILILAKDVGVVKILKKELPIENFVIQVANDKDEAKKIVNQDAPQMVILDYKTLRVEGFLIVAQLFKKHKEIAFYLIASENIETDFLEYFREFGIGHTVKKFACPLEIAKQISARQ